MGCALVRFVAAVSVASSAVLFAACVPSPPTAGGPTTAGPPPAASASPDPPTPDTAPDTARLFIELEERHGATVGVFAVSTGTGSTVEYRADERFGFASTIKALTVGAVLDSTNDDQVNAPIPVDAADLVPYSPILEQRVGGSVTLIEAADAAIRYSDNTAANLLVGHLGGPAALERQLRGIGDATTNVDRIEPALNDVGPGDDRDTSTPRALATSLRTYALGPALDEADRTLLVDLLKTNTTGESLIRAGAPAGWLIGDKTGSAAHGTRNDIAIAWPPSGADPVVLAVLSNRAEVDAEPVDALVAEAAAIVFDALSVR